MKTREVEDLLSVHADALAAGQDLTAELLAQRPTAAAAAGPLLALARRARAILRPVEPSAAFISALKAQLQQTPPNQPAAPAALQRPPWLLLALAGLGGLISIASAGVLAYSQYIRSSTLRVPISGD